MNDFKEWQRWEDLTIGNLIILLNRIVKEKREVNLKIKSLSEQIKTAELIGDSEDTKELIKQHQLLIKEKLRWTAI